MSGGRVVERWQWMANHAGGQARGNQRELRVLDEAAWRAFVRPMLRAVGATPPSTLAAFKQALPLALAAQMTHYDATRRWADARYGPWEMGWQTVMRRCREPGETRLRWIAVSVAPALGPLASLRPRGVARKWALRVERFDEPAAKRWSQRNG